VTAVFEKTVVVATLVVVVLSRISVLISIPRIVPHLHGLSSSRCSNSSSFSSERRSCGS
jgi:hypothetical protein